MVKKADSTAANRLKSSLIFSHHQREKTSDISIQNLTGSIHWPLSKFWQ